MNLERTLSDLVNQAYGLTPTEIDLMWKTAPPRMPSPSPVDANLSPGNHNLSCGGLHGLFAASFAWLKFPPQCSGGLLALGPGRGGSSR